MVSYEIRWKKSAISDLYRIDKQFLRRIIRAVEALTSNPFTQQSKKLHGVEQIYRLRVGDFRIIYEVDSSAKIITIYHIGYRKDIYQRMNF